MPDLLGRDPMPETIRQGTVRMEDHPQYAQTLASIEEQGFKVVFTAHSPCIVVRDVVDEQGKTLRVEREAQIRREMPFLDLEHEIGHLDQITHRLKEAMLPTERVLESGRASKFKQNLYTDWMNDISEYHNRLVEYIRLYKRRVDSGVLESHAQEVRIWREQYAKISREAQRGSSKAAVRMEWGQKFFPDIGELATAYREAGGVELERDWR